jgi:DNA repair protein RadC
MPALSRHAGATSPAVAIVFDSENCVHDPTPSQADIRMTKAIISIAEPLEILVHDDIIVDRNGHAGQKSPQLIRHCRERSSQQSSLRFPERS